MLRIFAGLVGLLALAAGFASLVIDGTRSIAGSQISLTPLGSLFAAKLPVFEKAVEHLHPMLWDPVAVDVLRLPVWVVLAVVGLIFTRLARRRPPEIGFVARP